MHNLIADNYHQLFFFLRSFCFTPSFYPQVHSSFFFSVPNFLIPHFHLSFYCPFFLFYIHLSIHPFFLPHSFPSFLLSFTFSSYLHCYVHPFPSVFSFLFSPPRSFVGSTGKTGPLPQYGSFISRIFPEYFHTTDNIWNWTKLWKLDFLTFSYNISILWNMFNFSNDHSFISFLSFLCFHCLALHFLAIQRLFIRDTERHLLKSF